MKLKTMKMEKMNDNIPGYPYYHITKDGKLFSRRSGNWLPKVTVIHSSGYERTSIRVNGKTRMVRIHRLVALAWLPNPYNYNEVMHLDDNKLNNKASNLRWCSHSENMMDASNKGRIYPKCLRNENKN